MSRDFVSEEPVRLAPGVSEMLRDPQHYRRTEMACVDYSEPAEPEPPTRWARFLAWLIRESE